MHELLNDSAHDAEWSRIRPVLDEAVRQLRPDDRDAILLRFFEGEAFSRIGARLRLSENAARMRVERALDKLHEQLTRRGIHSTSAALATVLAGQAVTAAPAALTASVTSVALVGAAGGGAVVSFFQFMAITKSQAIVAGALLLAGGATVTLQQQEQAALHNEIEKLRAQSAQLIRTREENVRLARLAAETEALRTAADEIPRLREEMVALQKKRQMATASRNIPDSRPGRPPRQIAAESAALNPTDHMPMVRFTTPPAYPAEMSKVGISGQATVKIVVDVNGDVQNASIVKSTHPELEPVALEAVKQWKFDPGMKGGRKVNTTIQVPIVFNVEPEEADWF
jgi:TonB family protein